MKIHLQALYLPWALIEGFKETLGRNGKFKVSYYVLAQDNWEVVVHVNQNVSKTMSRVMDFSRMNTSKFQDSLFEDVLKEFND